MLVDQHGPLLAAVPGQVALPVAVDVEPADHRGPSTGLFQTPVWTVRPRHETSCGIPTLTESRVAMTDALSLCLGRPATTHHPTHDRGSGGSCRRQAAGAGPACWTCAPAVSSDGIRIQRIG